MTWCPSRGGTADMATLHGHSPPQSPAGDFLSGSEGHGNEEKQPTALGPASRA